MAYSITHVKRGDAPGIRFSTHPRAEYFNGLLSRDQQRTAWNDYVPKHLLPRLYGYELMMAPYAIAHMKIGLKLGETGYRFHSQERARIYLTNALEPASEDAIAHAADLFAALGHEASEVSDVKRKQRYTVIVGNPPYSGVSTNMSEYAQRLVEAYKMVDGAALNERKVWLQDDYVKFIRWAQRTIELSGVGILGYITNHGYLDIPTFRGMRQSLMGTFPRLRVLDLHGNANKRDRSPDGSDDKNVFDIRQGVAICLAMRGGDDILVEHADLWGARESKYDWLARRDVRDTHFSALTPDSPYYFFKPQSTDYRAEYDGGWKINEAMPVNCAGFITARDHFVVDLDKQSLLERIRDFSDMRIPVAEIRAKYFAGCGSAKYPDGDTRSWKIPDARKRVANDNSWRERIRSCCYRPFDQRQIYWSEWMVDWPRPEISGHMLAGKNVAIHVCRQSVSDDWAHVLVARGLIDDCYVSNKTRERGYAHPLYLYARHGNSTFETGRQPNFDPRFLRELSNTVQPLHKVSSDLRGILPSEDIFNYIYAVLHSPRYRKRYAEFLRIDFPRIPLPGSLELFRGLAQLGGELVSLHLLESPRVDKFRTKFIGAVNTEVDRVAWADNTVWIDAPARKRDASQQSGSVGFQGVPEEVWNFHIGGYQVCEKWLKDRKGRRLSDDDIAHYQRIVVALTETIRIMAEIDEVIDRHGGWPGAFAVGAPPDDGQSQTDEPEQATLPFA